MKVELNQIWVNRGIDYQVVKINYCNRNKTKMIKVIQTETLKVINVPEDFLVENARLRSRRREN